jgi:UDP-3-O-[3-hydroxymyristoyl] glucosamine N-acyltransferase
VHGDVPAGAVYGGYPASEVRVWRRASAALLRLPEALRRLRRVERALGLGEEPPSEE